MDLKWKLGMSKLMDGWNEEIMTHKNSRIGGNKLKNVKK